MVSGATFADLDGDGWQDLILACQWGPVRVFMNQRGHLQEATDRLGLGDYVGWWNGVTVADFDGDGRLDIAASNWGLNGGSLGYERPALLAGVASQEVAGVPLVFWGEFGGAIGMGVIEAEYDAALGKVVPIRPKPALERGFPAIAGRFSTFAAYNSASVADLLGNDFASATRLSAPWLASTVFMQRNGKFEPVILPPEVQFSPSFGICAADFDGDGREDLFLAQNFFQVQPEAVRCDAGRSVLLRGDGHGNFTGLSGQESGLLIYGEQRGAATADYDHDGRVDLVVTQNGAATRLFHNVRARPGLRVRLVGPPGNPSGVGAVIRLRYGDRWGPAREVHAGAGYWSQDSAVQVLGTPEPPTAVWVRWPGGKIQQTPVSPGAQEIAVER